MKNLYPKGKGRIHPSPGDEALAVLRLLPGAILVLTAALGNEDKEVLAYLIMRSLIGAEESDDQRRSGKPGELVHTCLFGCGCFDCYTSFWSRWDCSPDRELIHQAIEAFEDHLASYERPTAKVKRRERRGDLSEKGKKKGKDHKEKPSSEDGSQKIPKEEMEEAFPEAVETAPEQAASEALVQETVAAVKAPAAAGDRRKGWADVAAIFNSRLWSLWSPGD